MHAHIHTFQAQTITKSQKTHKLGIVDNAVRMSAQRESGEVVIADSAVRAANSATTCSAEEVKV